MTSSPRTLNLLFQPCHAKSLRSPRWLTWAAIAIGTGLGAIACAAPGWTQTGNLSDVTGPIVTTSDLIQPSLQTEADGQGGSIVTTSTYAFPCTAAGVYVNDSLKNAIAQLQSGTLTPPSKGLPTTVSIGTYQNAQTNIAVLEQLNGFSANQLEAIATAQSPGELQGILVNSGVATSGVGQLTETLVLLRRAFGQIGLSAPETAQALRAFGTILASESITAEQLQQAIAIYNEVVNQASVEFLLNPAPELSVMQSLLEQMSDVDVASICGVPGGSRSGSGTTETTVEVEVEVE